MHAQYNNSAMGIFSVKTGFRFNYTRGNLFIHSTPDNPIIIRETGWFDFNDAGGPLVQYEIGSLGYTGAIAYNYDGAAPYLQESDLDLRIYTTTGVLNRAMLYAYEYVLTPNSAINNP